jgi:hypothetical protein
MRLALPLLLLTLLSPAGAGAADPDAAWAESDSMVVIQRQAYERSGRWSLSVFGGLVPNDPFEVYLPVGLRLGLFLNESFEVQLSGSYLDALAVDRDLRDRVASDVQLSDHQVARLQWSAGWTLLSAKGRWFGGEMRYLRAHLLGGFGIVLARDASDEIDPRPEGLFGLGIEAHLSDTTSLRVEARQGVFQRADGGALLPMEISVGWVSYFGGPLGGVR